MAEEIKPTEELPKIVPTISQASTPQEKVIRLLYKIAMLSSSSNCECEICKLARELAKELSNLI